MKRKRVLNIKIGEANPLRNSVRISKRSLLRKLERNERKIQHREEERAKEESVKVKESKAQKKMREKNKLYKEKSTKNWCGGRRRTEEKGKE